MDNDLLEIEIHRDRRHRKLYRCNPRDYILELNFLDCVPGDHIGKNPKIVEGKVKRYLSNLKMDISKYKFVVKE